MSRRRPFEEPPPEDDELELEPPPPELDEDEDDDVEYFVDPLELLSVRTSVPKSAQSAQTSSSAPSIFTVFGAPVSVPHISHWTIPWRWPRRRIKRVPPVRLLPADERLT
jgi:hypothetical protein